ncbi:M20 family metallopeptidase [Glutamicibacter endophyticus]|uniref:M20 family metallopeptidase n=1 Tax=Glutamicibacter endophyticus TaxID=1522174 RepID=UPI003AEFAD8E
MALRDEIIELSESRMDSGRFFADLSQLVACASVSTNGQDGFALSTYLRSHLSERLRRMGFVITLDEQWNGGPNSFLRAARFESEELPTVLCYGHADVVDGQAAEWSADREPFVLSAEGEKWYGRGTADNKGQHLVNLTALELLLEAQGSLGFNAIFLFEAGEEIGSPDLAEYALAHREQLHADIFIGSDGPRQAAGRPTIFLGARGGLSFELSVDLREGGFHSGNWGGLLRNPATTLAAAISTLVDGRGRIQVPELLPTELPKSVRAVLDGLDLPREIGDPAVDIEWGAEGLTPAERVYGWNTLEVLAMQAADPRHPVNAIPGTATAVLQLRFVAGTDIEKVPGAIRRALDEAGLDMVTIRQRESFPASRIEPDNPWVTWAADSIAGTTGQQPVILPNIGGSLPNYVFEALLGLPTVWVPHSYPGCRQHGPDEHALEPILRQGLAMMCGLFYDLGNLHHVPTTFHALTASQ